MSHLHAELGNSKNCGGKKTVSQYPGCEKWVVGFPLKQSFPKIQEKKINVFPYANIMQILGVSSTRWPAGGKLFSKIRCDFTKEEKEEEGATNDTMKQCNLKNAKCNNKLLSGHRKYFRLSTWCLEPLLLMPLSCNGRRLRRATLKSHDL